MGEESKEYFEKRLGDFKDEIIHQFHIISEDVISKVQQVGESVVNLNGKLDRGLDELDKKLEEKHQDVIAAIKFFPMPNSIVVLSILKPNYIR